MNISSNNFKISIDVNGSSTIKEFEQAIARAGLDITKELVKAINYTIKDAQRFMVKQAKKKIKLSDKKGWDDAIDVVWARVSTLVGIMTVTKRKRISLKRFNPMQTDQGVEYEIFEGKRKLRRGAFMGPKPGAVALNLYGHVWTRVGKSKLPIIRVMGPSIGNVFRTVQAPTVEYLDQRLTMQLNRRTKAALWRIDPRNPRNQS